MTSNIEKYKKDLSRLIGSGNQLLYAMYNESDPRQFDKQIKKQLKTPEKRAKFKKGLPYVNTEYQPWYSESLAVVKIVLPERVDDFVGFYQKPTNRKTLDYSNYSIADYLNNTIRKDGFGEIIVERSSALPKMQQQVAILESAKKRFESSLFDIKQLIQADLFDSELDAAKELNKKGYPRGAGAIAGVVLEAHLSHVCKNHKIKVTKKDPSINDLNDLLKKNDIIEMPDWRSIQLLSDLRTKCDHKKKTDPTQEEIEGLIDGVTKIAKSIF